MDLKGKHILVVRSGTVGNFRGEGFWPHGDAPLLRWIIAKKTHWVMHFLKSGVLGFCIELGPHDFQTFENCDLIVLSPGVPHTIEPVMRAGEKGIPMIGEIELAYHFINIPIIAVTGTNGKSTATLLIS